MPKVIEKTYTFAVSHENATVGGRLPGFWSVVTIITESMPLAEPGHMVMVHLPYARPTPLMGEAEIVDVKRGTACGSGERYTALAIKMLPTNDNEEE